MIDFTTLKDLYLANREVKELYINGSKVWQKSSGLTFTAEEANSTVAMTAVGSAPSVSLEYTTDGSTWNDFIVDSTTVTLPNVGDKVSIRAKTTNPSTATSTAYNRFVMTGKIAASDSIMYLLKKDGDLDTISAGYCFFYLFHNCSSLTTPPELPATRLAISCYQGIFEDCSSLTTAPELPATTLAGFCYGNMFYGCTSLTTAPELPATTLAAGCYHSMFSGCTSLTTAPELPATTLTQQCYSFMFNNCTSLNSIKIGYTGNFSGDGVPSYAFANWVNGVSSTGTFYYNGSDTTTGTSAIPTGWEVIESSWPGLTFTAEQANSTVAMRAVGSAPSVSLEYTTDGGYTWNDFLVSSSEEEGTTVTLTNIGDQVGLRAKTPNAQMATGQNDRNTFSFTGEVEASGNLASIFNKDVEQGKVLDSTLKWHFGGLFRGCSGLVGSAKNLKMPFVQMYGNSCETMFRESGITVAPDLPCMTVGIGSYSNMFYGCSSLTTAPELPATTIAEYSYYHMFENCTSLTIPPSVLPATAPYKECYRAMFLGCTSLTSTPDIKMENTWSTTPNVMWGMFKNCTSLETATVNYMTQNNASNGMAYMFLNCTSLKNVGLKRLRGVGTNIKSGMTQMLYGCSALEVVDFSEATAVPTLHSVNTFQNTNSTFQIVVPDALYDQWIVAGNWSQFANQIVKASTMPQTS